ncbi:uncharacterized protein LOC115014695 [Cottoperca gobio]|uniref:Uncharacterized protein LOC115014695 n=1 Tax=Cottoperca gobio TaxID=56716 RepID=A0A6J2QHZ5_COTGO|nr:uncharacterized protein LOC115014695 [Cottoperca gobio]
MMIAQFVAGASLFALLIVEICCHPVKQGSNPGASFKSSNMNTAPNLDLYREVPSGQFSPGAVRFNNAPSQGISTPIDHAVPDTRPSVSEFIVQREITSLVGSSSPGLLYSGNKGTLYQEVPSDQFSTGAVQFNNATSQGISTPIAHAVPDTRPSVSEFIVQREIMPFVGSSSPGLLFSGNRATSVRQNSTSSAQPEAGFQSASQDANWAVASPPDLFYGGEEMSTGTRGVVSSRPKKLSLLQPMYQAGELSNYELSNEHGDFERETEEQGWWPQQPRPMQESAGQGFASQPRPVFNMGRSLSPYHYYDFSFLTGQYPPGTFSHASSSYEQGRDYWQDVHYMKDSGTSNPRPEQQIQTFTGDFGAPQSIEYPSTPVGSPVMSGYGQGGAQPGLEASSPQHFWQSSRWPNHAY